MKASGELLRLFSIAYFPFTRENNETFYSIIGEENNFFFKLLFEEDVRVFWDLGFSLRYYRENVVDTILILKQSINNKLKVTLNNYYIFFLFF